MKNDIRKDLEQDARVITERIPMASKQKANDVAVKMATFIADHDLTQARVARMLAIGATRFSQFLNGKYPGNVEDVANKCVNLMNSWTRRERRATGAANVDTTVAKAIGALIVQTETYGGDEGKIGLIIGDGGHGKSHCMRAYARANKNTIYVELDDAMTPTLMFSEIAKALGMDASGPLAGVTRRLIDNLVNRHIIVMLDEASGLRVRQLNQLRQIIVVKSRCPLILAGNSDLLNTVTQSSDRRGHESLDQFYTRLMQILNLDTLASDNDGGLYTAEDMMKLYKYGGLRLTGDAVSALRRIARTPRSGRLRTCSHLISALHMSSAPYKQGNRIDAAMIADAIEQLNLPIAVRLPLGGAVAEETEIHKEIAQAG